MWKKISSETALPDTIVGNIITDNPQDPKDQYQIKAVQAGYVKAIHSNGRTVVKIFPVEELLEGKWWVKDK